MDTLTAKLPLIGKSIVEIRFFILVALALIIVSVPIVFLSLPSTLEKLIANSWCVDTIYYNGRELTPYTLGIRMESGYDNCSETMQFRENGVVGLPGINSYSERARWVFRNDSLIITSWSVGHDFTMGRNPEIIEKEDTAKKSIYPGEYSLEIKDNRIKMQSNNVTILGKAYRFDFGF